MSVAKLINELRHFFKINGPTTHIDKFSSILQRWLKENQDLPFLERLQTQAQFDMSHYVRNVIYKEEELFEIVIIGWLPNQHTSFHGHPCGGCLFTVLQGHLLETRETGEKQLLDISTDVQYIEDSLGKHKVECLSREKTISFHIYSPPFLSSVSSSNS